MGRGMGYIPTHVGATTPRDLNPTGCLLPLVVMDQDG